jgi:IS4 transposase
MTHCTPFSACLQKEISRRNLVIDSEFFSSFKALRIASLMRRSNMVKRKGYEAMALLYVLLLLPFLMQRVIWSFSGETLTRFLASRKDTYYRFLANERFNWRAFIYRLALRVIAFTDEVPLKEKTLIVDDTIEVKTGEHMEMVSYHFDAVRKRNTRMRNVDRRTNGWKRRKEAFRKRTEMMVELVRRAYNNGIDAAFVLFDGWFAHDRYIGQIKEIGYDVICRLKRSTVRYAYEGKSYTLSGLWKVAQKRLRLLPDFGVKGACLNVTLRHSGDVRVLFVTDGKVWHALLSTDRDLEPNRILTIYARRWAIELFFKDGKQLLSLGKDQCQTFDGVIACYSLVMIRYLLLVHILIRHDISGPLGPLFRELVQAHLQLAHTATLWASMKQVLILSSELLWPQMEPEKFLQFMDIVEEALMAQVEKLSAKV